MTTHAIATETLRNTRARKSFFHPATLLALGIAAATTLGVWDVTNRPVAVPDYAGQVSGLAFSPFHRGETPEANRYPSTAEIRDDLQKASRITGRIRTYALTGDMGQIPALAGIII